MSGPYVAFRVNRASRAILPQTITFEPELAPDASFRVGIKDDGDGEREALPRKAEARLIRDARAVPDVASWRAEKDRYFRESPESPVPEDQRAARHQLRRHLAGIGCGTVADAPWICPAHLSGPFHQANR